MPRAMSSSMLAAIQASLVQPALLVSIGFSTTTVYIWSGIGDLTWNAQTWKGLGSLLDVSMVEDAATVEARGVTVTLSALDSTLLSNSLTEYQLGAPMAIYLGLFSAGSLLADPIVIWAGLTDEPTVNVAGDKATIAINGENELLMMNVSVQRYRTNEDQQLVQPGDLGLQFVNAIQEMTIFWGQQANNTNNI